MLPRPMNIKFLSTLLAVLLSAAALAGCAADDTTPSATTDDTTTDTGTDAGTDTTGDDTPADDATGDDATEDDATGDDTTQDDAAGDDTTTEDVTGEETTDEGADTNETSDDATEHAHPSYTLNVTGAPTNATVGEAFTFTLTAEGDAGESDHIGAHFAATELEQLVATEMGGCAHVSGELPGTFEVSCTIDEAGVWFVYGHVRTSHEGETLNFWADAFTVTVEAAE